MASAVTSRRAVAVLHARDELATARAAMPGTVAVVMTMGALHEGHAALFRAARAAADHLLVTIFVNPLQFGAGEDLDRYPRTLEGDLDLCRREGVDAVFAPSVPQVYPGGEPRVRVDPGPLADILEGASRPGHFAGVLTVVLKLLQLTRPHRSCFGEKDYQQLTLIRAMVTDLDLPVQIIGVPTVREPGGLARSSRNRYLSAEERASALALNRALRSGAAAAGAGAAAAEVLAAASEVLTAEPGVRLDYLTLVDPQLGPVPAEGPARLLVAARVGGVRLIDNAPVVLGSGFAVG